ncbi:hypothetical protein Taro_026580 [Colocasia esculenta]|uniref:Uncharacterized protein n=1 Tax=Colocasia esculenta TaxID=4460 RepID=A0A843VP08_COLES|nr:hypothetical protein [Colocasia esculenta]
MGLQLCVCRCGVGWSPQLFDFFLVEQQLDLSSVTARLRGPVWVVSTHTVIDNSLTQAPDAQGLSRYRSTVRVCVVFRDTITPVFELYVRLKERRQGQRLVFVGVKEIRRVPVPLLVPVGIIVELGLRHQQSNLFTCGALGVCPGLLYAPYVVTNNAMMVEYFIRWLRPELQDAMTPLMCGTVKVAAQRAAILERTIQARQSSRSGSSGEEVVMVEEYHSSSSHFSSLQRSEVGVHLTKEEEDEDE